MKHSFNNFIVFSFQPKASPKPPQKTDLLFEEGEEEGLSTCLQDLSTCLQGRACGLDYLSTGLVYRGCLLVYRGCLLVYRACLLV